jgi:glucose-1-phosphate adenylyltransferase
MLASLTPPEIEVSVMDEAVGRINFDEQVAEITVAVLPVARDRVKELGILRSDQNGRITDFTEKPQEESKIDEFKIDESTFQKRGIQPIGRSHVASMGVYLFNKDVLTDCLGDENMPDFGKHVIPASIGARKVYAHFFDGYWRDVGTIKSFYEANLELTHLVPEFDFYNESTPVYTRPRFLPGSKVNGCFIQSSILSEGSIITGCEIQNSIIGIRSIVRSGAKILNSVVMGGDYYESLEEQSINSEKGLPSIGIGEGSLVQNAILDHNVRIGRNVRIVNQQGRENYDGPDFTIRDGIIVIHKNAILPDDTVI